MPDDDADDNYNLLAIVIAIRMKAATAAAKVALESAKGGLCALSVPQVTAYCDALRALDDLERSL